MKMAINGIGQGFLNGVSPSSSYESAMSALSSLITRRKRGDGSTRKQKFDLMFKYLEILGLEERMAELKVIHIAGTKGKGSTCTFSEAILRECGFRTGLFTSPHLIDVRERYRINGLDISEETFLLYFWDCWNQLKEKAVEGLPMPPLFQFLTLLAFKTFLSEKVDVAILEVGLGGAFDATNVVKPVVCGVTSLGMDHTEILGDTIAKIASEKAGIFKPHVPAFTVQQLSEGMHVLQERASELMIPLEEASPLSSKMLNGRHLGLAGDHQFVNSGLAVELCRCWLQRTGHQNLFPNDIVEEGLPVAFLRGLSSANLPGRAQIVRDKLDKSDKISEIHQSSGDLIFYLDGAHSPESMEVCARWFSNAIRDEQNFPRSELVDECHTQHNTQVEESCVNVSSKTSKKILLFNCMEVRDPQLLLPQLINTCASSGFHFSKALFVPSISTYHRVDSGSSAVSSESAEDISWQSTLQRTWEKITHGRGDSVHNSQFEKPEDLLPDKFISESAPLKCNPAVIDSGSSAVIPSLPLTIKWLRDCARDNPSLRFQVLVTGSIHLVGDVLRLLKR